MEFDVSELIRQARGDDPAAVEALLQNYRNDLRVLRNYGCQRTCWRNSTIPIWCRKPVCEPTSVSTSFGESARQS